MSIAVWLRPVAAAMEFTMGISKPVGTQSERKVAECHSMHCKERQRHVLTNRSNLRSSWPL